MPAQSEQKSPGASEQHTPLQSSHVGATVLHVATSTLHARPGQHAAGASAQQTLVQS
jgi:hypothetical protein